MDPKKAIVEKSRHAREERALAKRQEKAILTVQSLVRRYLVRCRLCREVETVLNEELKAVNEDPEKDFKSCFQAIERYLIANHLKRDVKHLNKFYSKLSIICKCITTSIMADCSLKHSYVGLVLQKDCVKTWSAQVQSLIKLSLMHCENLDISQSAHKDTFLIYLRMALLLTEVTAWKQVAAVKQFQLLKVGLTNVANVFLTHYQSNGAIRILGKNLFKHFASGTSAQLSELVITSVLTIFNRIFNVCKHSNEVIDEYCVFFLTIPGIIALVADYSTPSKLIFKDSLSIKLLNYLSLEKNLMSVVCTLDFNKLLFILANCIQIGYLDRETVLTRKVRPNFVDVTCSILRHLQVLCSFDNKASGSKYWHEIFGYIPQTINRCNCNLKVVKQQLACLWKPELAESLFSTLMEVNSVASNVFQQSSSSATTSGKSPSSQIVSESSLTSTITASSVPAVKSKSKASKLFRKAFPSLGASKATSKCLVSLDSLEMFHVSGVCNLYQLAKDVLSQCKVEMLCGITRLENILPHMLHFILLYASRDAAKFFTDICAKNSKAISSANGEFYNAITDLHERALSVFSLFCECTWYLTTILDDIEVYEQDKLFVMSDLQLLVLFLNQLCFNLIWNESYAIMPTVFNGVHSLLILLVERNYRRQFLPLESLLIKDIKTCNFWGEYDKNRPRANYLIEKIPHVLPHKDRVLLFRRLVNDEKLSLGLTESTRHYPKSTLITIRRNTIVEDGFDQLSSLSDANFKGLIRVKFVNEQGLMEAGIDQDGVFKEFLEESISKIFNPELNLFKLTEDQKLYPSPTSNMHELHISLFEYVGKLLGKAVYEGIVLEVQFATFFLTQLLGTRGALYSCIDELPSLDEQLFRSLSYIKHYDGDVADLQLTFSCDEDEMGRVKTYDLIPGGSLEPVTNSNKILYIHSMALFKMHTQIKKQSVAFNRGFKSIIKQHWMGMFSGPELQRLISGDECDLDITDMRNNTIYYGGYHNQHKVIKWFWDILENEFTREERSLLLKFCTSCSKPPLLGFSYLEPAFSIRRVEQPDDTDEGDTVGSIVRGFFSLSGNKKGENVSRLPTSSTCFNLLKLPHYQKRTTLRDKLRYAVHSHVGFELS